MKFSVITPSYNQGNFIGQTIESVLSQAYPDIEYIVVDGGSTDNTIDILKSYGDRIKWISEKDNGQTDAINKGMRMATGDILSYINSDDYFLPNTFDIIFKIFKENPQLMWLDGQCLLVDENGHKIQSLITSYRKFLRLFPTKSMLSFANYISQPSAFWRREVMQEIGLFDENLRYTMDYDYWMRLFEKYPVKIVKENFACFRIHSSSKGGSQFKFQFVEELQVLRKYNSNKFLYFLHYLHNLLIVTVYNIIK